MRYIQCIVVSGNREQVTGLTERFARLGSVLKLKGEDGWRVTFVGSEVVPFSAAIAKQHRKNTGDALPKWEAVPDRR